MCIQAVQTEELVGTGQTVETVDTVETVETAETVGTVDSAETVGTVKTVVIVETVSTVSRTLLQYFQRNCLLSILPFSVANNMTSSLI